MRKRRKSLEVALALFSIALWLGTSAKPLYAYTDPGTGLMAIQIVGSTFAGFLFLIRKRIINLFGRLNKATGKNSL
jgi:hypothetical protein